MSNLASFQRETPLLDSDGHVTDDPKEFSSLSSSKMLAEEAISLLDSDGHVPNDAEEVSSLCSSKMLAKEASSLLDSDGHLANDPEEVSSSCASKMLAEEATPSRGEPIEPVTISDVLRGNGRNER